MVLRLVPGGVAALPGGDGAMSAWLPTGVYAWVIGLFGQDWPVVVAPGLALICWYALTMVLGWVDAAFGHAGE